MDDYRQTPRSTQHGDEAERVEMAMILHGMRQPAGLAQCKRKAENISSVTENSTPASKLCKKEIHPQNSKKPADSTVSHLTPPTESSLRGGDLLPKQENLQSMNPPTNITKMEPALLCLPADSTELCHILSSTTPAISLPFIANQTTLLKTLSIPNPNQTNECNRTDELAALHQWALGTLQSTNGYCLPLVFSNSCVMNETNASAPTAPDRCGPKAAFDQECIQKITAIQEPAPRKKLQRNEKKALKICRMEMCDELAARRTPYCPRHAGPRKCEHEGCTKCAQGRTRYCIAHGGGRRCSFPRCTKGARDKKFCAFHGGGKRCTVQSCAKLAVGASNTCTAHGGGKRCQAPDCDKSAQSSFDFCVRHGGGRQCAIDGCVKVARGKTSFCMSHSAKNRS